ncbi:MAG: M56 family metallopeptidase [Nitrososphaeria archaeon]|jgi:heat shock protein HtpX
MTERTFTYTVGTKISPNLRINLLDFIYQRYILPQEKMFENVLKDTTDGDPYLSYSFTVPKSGQKFDEKIIASEPIQIIIKTYDDTVTEEKIIEEKEDVEIAIDLFEEQIRKSTLFFAWGEGEKIVPERVTGKERSLNRLLMETQILILILFIGVGIVVFAFLGSYALIPFLGIQLVVVLYSSKIVGRVGDWRITERNPTIHFLEYHLPSQEADMIRKKFTKEQLIALKREVYEKTVLKDGEIDCQTVNEIFAKYGLYCRPEDLSSKKVNVYQMVKTTADKFGFKMPKIVVANTLLPNASASGPSPSRGLVMITTGLLVQLEEAEIVSVLGHEFGHLKGRDPLLLYGLNAIQYLVYFFVFIPFVSSLLLFFIYFWAISAIFFSVAKCLEARADLISAIVIQQPQVLAEALQKIGFKRLILERMRSYRIQEWLSLEAHPPMYFRVHRLEKIKDPSKIRHPLIRSIADVTHGFIANIK